MSEAPAPEPAFAELVAATNYSFLRGASHPAEMVAEAIALGMTGIGIADRNSVAGVVRALTGLRRAEAKKPLKEGWSFHPLNSLSARGSSSTTAPPTSSPIRPRATAGAG